jgi:hypothetical protein
MTSVSPFDTSAHADASTNASSEWVREQRLETAIPNAPKSTSGEAWVQAGELVQA